MKEEKHFPLENGDKLILILENATSDELNEVYALLQDWNKINIIIGTDRVKFMVVPRGTKMEFLDSKGILKEDNND